jgi:hypothetical protein
MGQIVIKDADGKVVEQDEIEPARVQAIPEVPDEGSEEPEE